MHFSGSTPDLRNKTDYHTGALSLTALTRRGISCANMPLACFLYALLRFESHAPKTKKPPDGGSFVLVETRGISCALKTCRWHVFFTRFSGSIPALRKQKNRRMAVFLFWWRRGESNPCPKARPQGLLRAQSFYSNSRPAAPNDRLSGLVASSFMGGAKLTRRTFTAK